MNFEDLTISKSQQSVEETLKTEIRRLEEEIKHKIAMKLEKRNNFEDFMLALPKSPDVFLSKNYESDDYPRKYNIEQVQAIQSASEFQKRRRLNGEILFDEWGTSGHQRPCVVHLIVVLDKIKLYNASNILRTHIGMNEKYNNTVVHSLNIDNESISDGVELKVMKDIQNNLSDEEDNDDEDLVGPTESLTDLNIKEFAYTDIRDKTNNFNSQSFIGSGGFGKVYLATNLVDNIPLVAVKVMTKIDAQEYKHYYRELKIISELEHENILKLLGYSFEREACVIYEYASGGSLSTLLEKTRKSAEKYEFKDRVKNLWEISKALLYLHNEKNLVHRDVKPENILLDGGVAKLCDFGLTKSLVEGLATETRIAGTNQYMAPELHRYEVTASADVYAFGLVLLITLTDLKVVDKQRGEDDLFLPNFIEKRITDTTKHYEFMQTSTEMPCKSESRLKLIELALDCTRTDKTLRPPIKLLYENLLARLEG